MLGFKSLPNTALLIVAGSMPSNAEGGATTCVQNSEAKTLFSWSAVVGTITEPDMMQATIACDMADPMVMDAFGAMATRSLMPRFIFSLMAVAPLTKASFVTDYKSGSEETQQLSREHLQKRQGAKHTLTPMTSPLPSVEAALLL